MQNLGVEVLPRISATLSEIYRRVGLNFFGVDCHVATDGVMTLFEANATMNILHNQPSPNRWDETCAAIRAKLEAALEKHARSVMAASKRP